MPDMNCSECQAELPPKAKFCSQCGTAVPSSCPSCGIETPPGAKFCHECGTSLAVVGGGASATAPSSAPGGPSPLLEPLKAPPISAPVPTLAHRTGELASELSGLMKTSDGGHAERRQLSVIFSDLASFTQLSQELDPEDLNAVVHEYYEVCRAVCDRYNGKIANYLGDGVLIFFGYPAAHEDDAHRAVRTGLAIVEGILALSQRLEHALGHPLAVRVGIHTGLMITDDDRGGDWQKMALGDTLNIAARIQSVARENSVVISQATRELVEGFFSYQSIGSHQLKGVETPQDLFRVTHESTARSRLEAIERSALTPMTGRDEETEILLREWELASQGEGRVLLMRGEAGIGKSRLVQMLKEHVASLPDAWMTPCQCSPYHQNTAMHPYIDLIERVVLKFDRSESVREKLKKLEGMLVQYGFHIPEALPIFGAFHSLPPEAGYTPSTAEPSQQRRFYMDSMLRILRERSEKQPLLFVVEDLHWIDPTSLETLKEIADGLEGHRMLALFTARLEFESPWGDHPRVQSLDLDRLPAEKIRSICRRVARGKGLPDEVLEQIIQRADGIALFAEELTKMIIGSALLEERGDHFELVGPLPELAIPSTLQDSLMARLDKLSTVKEIAQIAAVIGRSFTYELIRCLSPVEDAVLRHSLGQLVEADLLTRESDSPEAPYHFAHALIQEAAYQSLVKTRRRRYHLQIAEAIEEHFPEVTGFEPEVLAYHYAKAREGQRAVPYLQKAGDRASERSSHKEAIVHYQRALETIRQLPRNHQIWQTEIELLIGLGVSLTAIHGYGAEDVRRTYSRARDLCEQVGNMGKLFQARYGLWRLRMLRAEYDIATRQGEELLELAQRQENDAFLIAAHRSLGSTLFYRGQWRPAREHVETVIRMTTGPEYGDDTLIRDIYDVVDPRVTCHSYRAWILWMQGFPDQARAESQRALDLADQFEHPFSQALARSFATWLHQFIGDVEKVVELSKAAISLSNEYGFSFWVGWGRVLQGWAEARRGADAEESITRIHEGLAFWREKGSDLGRGYFLCLLAETHLNTGGWASALDALAQSQSFADQRDERYWESERIRLKGELSRARSNDSPQAETHFRQALEIATEQDTLSLQLRAATSLARHLHDQVRGTEARAALEPIYERFTEGFETPDLAAARELLESLG